MSDADRNSPAGAGSPLPVAALLVRRGLSLTEGILADQLEHTVDVRLLWMGETRSGETIMKGQVLRRLVNPGDTITLGQVLLEVEARKTVIDVPSYVGGRVTAVGVDVGDRVSLGQSILTLVARRGDEAREHLLRASDSFARGCELARRQQRLTLLTSAFTEVVISIAVWAGVDTDLEEPAVDRSRYLATSLVGTPSAWVLGGNSEELIAQMERLEPRAVAPPELPIDMYEQESIRLNPAAYQEYRRVVEQGLDAFIADIGLFLDKVSRLIDPDADELIQARNLFRERLARGEVPVND